MTGGGNGFFAQIPAQFQAIVVDGFHAAFTLALGNSVWLGVGATVAAVAAAAFLKEIPLRATTGAPAAAAKPGAEIAGRGRASVPD